MREEAPTFPLTGKESLWRRASSKSEEKNYIGGGLQLKYIFRGLGREAFYAAREGAGLGQIKKRAQVEEAVKVGV